MTAAQPVAIVGLYKCGTSWLLSILAAHPQAIGLREIDVVRAATDETGALRSLDERVRGLFSGHPWCHGDPGALSGLVAAPAERAAEVIASARGAEARRYDRSRPACFEDLAAPDRAKLFEAVRSATDAKALFDHFVEINGRLDPSARVLVLKAADQIAVFDRLEGIAPGAPKIAIVRDGRDASISALHFRRLMKAQNAPWYRAGQEPDYMAHLRAWAHRARLAADLAARGTLRIVRYEDLTLDYQGTLAPILDELGLDHDPATIASIDERTSFEAVTGRKRGEEAEGVVRRGAIREWMERLEPAERDEAWRIAGEALAGLGYGRDGSLEPCALGGAGAIPSGGRSR